MAAEHRVCVWGELDGSRGRVRAAAGQAVVEPDGVWGVRCLRR